MQHTADKRITGMDHSRKRIHTGSRDTDQWPSRVNRPSNRKDSYPAARATALAGYATYGSSTFHWFSGAAIECPAASTCLYRSVVIGKPSAARSSKPSHTHLKPTF